MTADIGKIEPLLGATTKQYLPEYISRILGKALKSAIED